jgi:hypothetical protein
VSKQLDKSNIKLGIAIKHQFSNQVTDIVFIGEGYILCERKQNPMIILEEYYDLWVISPRILSIDLDKLRNIWETSSSWSSFMGRINRYEQDFKESSLP